MGEWFDNFCESTSCHGFVHLRFATKKSWRILWAILLISLALQLCYSEVNLILRYFDPAQRWTTSSYEVRKEYLPHPTINICNYNRLKRSKLEDIGLDEKFLEYPFSLTRTVRSLNFIKSVDPANKAGYQAWRTNNKNQIKNYQQLGKFAGHKCEDMVKYLALTHTEHGVTYAIDALCNSTLGREFVQFQMVASMHFGVECVQMRVNDTGPYGFIVVLGEGKGTTLLLDIDPDEYLKTSLANFADVGIGIQLSYGGKTEMGGFINAPPGFHSWISMKQAKQVPGEAFDSFFEPPCIAKPKMRFMPDEFYSTHMCKFDCLMIAMVACGDCYLMEIPGYRMCEVEEIEYCVLQMVLGNITESTKLQMSKCVNETCKDPCYSKSIKSTVSYTSFPPENQLEDLSILYPKIFANKSIQEVRRRYALVDIFYGLGSVTVVEWRQRTPFGILTANIGGQMGLFLGISIVTLVHSFVYFCAQIGSKIQRKLKKNTNVNLTNPK